MYKKLEINLHCFENKHIYNTLYITKASILHLLGNLIF